MRADDGVVEVRREDLGPRDAELGTDEHRQEAAHTEEHQGHDQVLDADDLVVGRVLPVAELALALAGHVLGVSVGEVVAQNPANRPGESTDAGHEPDDPRYVGGRDEGLIPDLLERGVLGAPRHKLAAHCVGDDGQHDAGDEAGEDVGAVQEATGLAVLLGLGNGRLLVNVLGHNAHEVFAPPITRTQFS